MNVTEKNWWLQYPTVRSQPESIDIDKVRDLIEDKGKIIGTDFAVIDVRGTDREGGHVRGSDNWRAQDFYPRLEEFGRKYRHVPQVFFYCSKSNGRGPRIASWYQDWLDDTGTLTSRAYVLCGGIVAWKASYGTNPLLTEDFVSEL